MKCKTIIDVNEEERVLIYAHSRNDTVEKIEALLTEKPFELIGYNGREFVSLSYSEIFCFISEDNRIYALTEKGKLKIKARLYQIEQSAGSDFVKINKSCIANIKKIAKFDASLSGNLLVVLKNGYRDYVSRRQIKTVKERVGLKK